MTLSYHNQQLQVLKSQYSVSAISSLRGIQIHLPTPRFSLARISIDASLLKDKKPSARFMPAASALASLAAIEAYTEAILYRTAARSKVNDGKLIGASGVRENGGGKGR